MFAKVVCKRGVKVVDSAKVKPQSKVKDSMTPEEAARAAWDDLDDDDKIAKFNEWAYDNDPAIVVYANDESTMRELFESPLDAVRAVYYGNYDYPDEYMVFNGYGNLASFTNAHAVVHSHFIDFIDDVIAWMVSNKDFGAYAGEVIDVEDEFVDE
jgi:hypothetical protein|nr:MAG TPA: hypothetical protein [Caudoviricetes sp.]